MSNFEIVAETRDAKGKGASRRLRRDGKVPAILYGARSEPVAIQLAHNDMLLKSENEAFYSTVLTLKLDGSAEKVVIKDMQRHAYKPTIVHLDFQRVDESEELTMRVPIHFTNEDRCVGVKTGGGLLSHMLTELEITCLPKDLPEYIEVDVGSLELGDAVHLGDVTMPEGVAITALSHGGDASRPVVSVQIPKLVVEDLEEEAEAAEGLEGLELAEGEEAAEETGDESVPDKSKKDE
jgi:large subunit ribosomal protein L25